MALTPEEQAEKDKEAIQKMIGAKGAMEAALREIERLRNTIKAMKSAHDDCMKAVADDVLIRAYRNDDGTYLNEVNTVKVHAISHYIASLAEKAKG